MAPMLSSIRYGATVLTPFWIQHRDPLGTGYHIIQSQIAMGSGSIGKGVPDGTQSHLEFLPERHTDFILAVIGEELGAGRCPSPSLALYLFLIYRGLAIAANASDAYGRVLAGGLSLVFFVYVFVNTGMVVGLLPVVGVPLPLVSYGVPPWSPSWRGSACSWPCRPTEKHFNFKIVLEID